VHIGNQDRLSVFGEDRFPPPRVIGSIVSNNSSTRSAASNDRTIVALPYEPDSRPALNREQECPLFVVVGDVALAREPGAAAITPVFWTLVPRPVNVELAAAGQRDFREHAPALILHRPALDLALLHLGDEGVDVVAHEKERVAGALRLVHGDSGGGRPKIT
jgi:hypothetical protein